LMRTRPGSPQLSCSMDGRRQGGYSSQHPPFLATAHFPLYGAVVERDVSGFGVLEMSREAETL
jgi:hypothetical protein